MGGYCTKGKTSGTRRRKARKGKEIILLACGLINYFLDTPKITIEASGHTQSYGTNPRGQVGNLPHLLHQRQDKWHAESQSTQPVMDYYLT
jgi:hypothetical protein